MFHNPEIPLDDLPGAGALDWLTLHPSYARRLRVSIVLVVAIIGIAIAALNFVPGIGLWQVALFWTQLLIFAVALLIWPAFSVPRRGYVLRDKDILFRKGVVWRSVTAVPFNRIQHVETSSTPLDRRYGLATLQLFTAGGSGGDLKIDGLGKETAEQLRTFILEKTGATIENA